MFRNYAEFKIALIFGILVLLLGCAETPRKSAATIYVPAVSSLTPEEYPREIEKYEAIIQSDDHSNIQQQAHLYLASLYASPLNPARNYALARKHLETYALFDPDFTNAVDPRILLGAIIQIERLSAVADAQAAKMLQLSQELEGLNMQLSASEGYRQYIQKDNLRLKKRIDQLQHKIRSLEASNNQLHKTIEMLSTLDSRLEEKRSNFIKSGSAEAK
jgi:DNA repair exonuclease SbcCD ATPase subunit